MYNPDRDAGTLKTRLGMRQGDRVQGLQEVNHIRMGSRRITNWIIWDLKNTSWGHYALDCDLGAKKDYENGCDSLVFTI